MRPDVQVTFVLATYNRCEVLRRTLTKLQNVTGELQAAEIIVVDNHSTDGTAEMIRRAFPQVRLLTLNTNLGSCAKARGICRAAGKWIVFLDDDACPQPGTMTRMLQHFASDPRLGAAGLTVHLPDGRRESAALPDVFVGCGVGFRKEALREVGGLDPTLFMQAEEYDLAFRLARAGWTLKVFEDLHVDHDKTPHARLSSRTVFYDTRNNLLVAARYLPDSVFGPLRQDYLQRYRWIAENAGQLPPYMLGRRVGLRQAHDQRRAHARWRLDADSFESLFRFQEIHRRMQQLAETGIRRIALADLGKNIYPFVKAAQATRIRVECIGDDRLSRPDRYYRGIPVLPTSAALQNRPEAIVVANTAPVHAAATSKRLAAQTDVPIHCWFA